MSSSEEHVRKWGDASGEGNLRPEQVRICRRAYAAAERSVVPVEIRYAAEPICKFVLPGNLPAVQIRGRRIMEVQVRVSGEQFHSLFLCPQGNRSQHTESKQQHCSSKHTNGPGDAAQQKRVRCDRVGRVPAAKLS